MFKKALVVLALVVSSTGASYAQTAGQSVTGFLLAQGSTYNGYTCPSAATSPCFVQYGSTVPTSGTVTVDATAKATAAAPSYVEGSNSPFSIDLSGNQRVIPIQSVGITPTDGTITSATGSSQTVFASNASRHGLIVQNTGNANCGVNPTGGTAVIGGAGTLTLLPSGSYQPRIPTLSAVTAICTAGQPLYAEQN